MTPEGRVKAQVKRQLELLRQDGYGVYHFMPVPNGMGAPALDFFICINGRFVAVETKAAGKTLTPRQQLTAQAITEAGGHVYVVSPQTDIVMVFQMIRNTCTRERLSVA